MRARALTRSCDSVVAQPNATVAGHTRRAVEARLALTTVHTRPPERARVAVVAGHAAWAATQAGAERAIEAHMRRGAVGTHTQAVGTKEPRCAVVAVLARVATVAHTPARPRDTGAALALDARDGARGAVGAKVTRLALVTRAIGSGATPSSVTHATLAVFAIVAGRMRSTHPAAEGAIGTVVPSGALAAVGAGELCVALAAP